MGVKSTALRFGDSTKEWLSGFGIACISSLALSGFNADLGIYLLFLLSQQLPVSYNWPIVTNSFHFYFIFESRMALLCGFDGCIWAFNVADLDS